MQLTSGGGCRRSFMLPRRTMTQGGCRIAGKKKRKASFIVYRVVVFNTCALSIRNSMIVVDRVSVRKKLEVGVATV